MLLWPWRRLAAAAPVRPLAWKPPYALGAALKSKKEKKIPPSDSRVFKCEMCISLLGLL